MNIEDQMKRFVGLPYETKRTKVIGMLKKLQWTHDVFSMLYTKITVLASVSETILSKIYQWIFEVAAELEQWNKKKAEEKIKHMSDVLMAIRKQEEMEIAREWNPDDLLQSL